MRQISIVVAKPSYKRYADVYTGVHEPLELDGRSSLRMPSRKVESRPAIDFRAPRSLQHEQELTTLHRRHSCHLQTWVHSLLRWHQTYRPSRIRTLLVIPPRYHPAQSSVHLSVGLHHDSLG